jgi:UDP-N-acetyl-D-mannosaminuronic acid dehydrogenase
LKNGVNNMSTLNTRDLKSVAVFGQGFVGLPLSLSLAFRGCTVYGVDVISSLVEDINNGITHHTEAFEGKTIQTILGEQLENGNYRATSDMESAIRACNNIVVTVGIPIKENGHDLSELTSCIKVIGKNIKRGDLLVIRSTVIPGTTEEVILPILEKESGMRAGEDFYLAYSSERIAESNAFNEFAYMPTVVAGINAESAIYAKALLEIVCKVDVVIASNIKIVETAKVFENVQRDVNIAMVQEFARFTEALGIDIHEVVRVANTHKRVNLLIPGPGVGGYCVPNAYHYLKPRAEEFGVSLDILELSRSKNDKLPETMVEILEKELLKLNKSLSGARIGILGIAMKDYSNDDRISPPLHIIKLLEDRGARVSAFDPAVPTEYSFKVDSLDEAITNMDGIMVLARQKEFEGIQVEELLNKFSENTVVFDVKNLFKSFEKELVESNIVYKTI